VLATPLARAACLIEQDKNLAIPSSFALQEKSLNNAIRSAAADRHPRSSVCSAT